MENKKSIKKGKSKKDYQKSLLKKIAKQAIKKNACSEQLMPFLHAIDNGDYLLVKSSYKNGYIHGLYKEWFRNDQLYISCNYKNGLLCGTYKMWDRNGNLLKDCRYFHGSKMLND